jgi:hypothetical protein
MELYSCRIRFIVNPEGAYVERRVRCSTRDVSAAVGLFDAFAQGYFVGSGKKAILLSIHIGALPPYDKPTYDVESIDDARQLHLQLGKHLHANHQDQ